MEPLLVLVSVFMRFGAAAGKDENLRFLVGGGLRAFFLLRLKDEDEEEDEEEEEEEGESESEFSDALDESEEDVDEEEDEEEDDDEEDEDEEEQEEEEEEEEEDESESESEPEVAEAESVAADSGSDPELDEPSSLSESLSELSVSASVPLSLPPVGGITLFDLEPFQAFTSFERAGRPSLALSHPFFSTSELNFLSVPESPWSLRNLATMCRSTGVGAEAPLGFAVALGTLLLAIEW